MCGIAGLVDATLASSASELAGRAEAMASTLAHRGPDDHGVWTDPAVGVAFGHRRLSIIDLSSHGHQPMMSGSGRWVLIFNGEIYNYKQLRSVLAQRGVHMRGTSDTEVLLEYIEHFGLVKALQAVDGMFAFAGWDRSRRVLVLARDRMGEKPLYYGTIGRSLVFASELKAIRAHPDFQARLDPSAVTAFLRLSYVPAPLSIYEGIVKLPAGSYLEVPDGRPCSQLRPTTYWNLPALRAVDEPPNLLEELDSTLTAAVASRMIADVPIGAFLSGGIDSSLVVALMQRLSAQPVHTFSIGFEDAAYNEAAYANSVARYLGTDHHELYVSSTDTLDVVPKLPSMYDEPFADSSQVPTFLVSQMTRAHVTVALSGDGGDELFGGYSRYLLHMQMWHALGRTPSFARMAAARAIRAIEVDAWDILGRPVNRLLPRRTRQPHFGDKAHKVARLLAATSPRDTYRIMMSHWQHPESVVVGGREPPLPPGDAVDWPQELSMLGQMMYLDARTYLPDDILVKVDRAAMAVGLETRVPLLAPSVIELAARIPDRLRIHRGRGKIILRSLLHRYIPKQLVERPKMGFGVPIGSWMRGPLRPWVEDLLAPESLAGFGLLDAEIVRNTWAEHISGKYDHKYQLWNVLMLLEWHRITRESGGRPLGPVARSNCSWSSPC